MNKPAVSAVSAGQGAAGNVVEETTGLRTAVPAVRHRAGDLHRAARELLRMLELSQMQGDGADGVRGTAGDLEKRVRRG